MLTKNPILGLTADMETSFLFNAAAREHTLSTFPVCSASRAYCDGEYGIPCAYSRHLSLGVSAHSYS